MQSYPVLKSAAPAAAKHLIEVTGHVLAPHREAVFAWCRRVGCPIEEFDAVVHAYRVRVDRGDHPAHAEHY